MGFVEWIRSHAPKKHERYFGVHTHKPTLEQIMRNPWYYAQPGSPVWDVDPKPPSGVVTPPAPNSPAPSPPQHRRE